MGRADGVLSIDLHPCDNTRILIGTRSGVWTNVSDFANGSNRRRIYFTTRKCGPFFGVAASAAVGPGAGGGWFSAGNIMPWPFSCA